MRMGHFLHDKGAGILGYVRGCLIYQAVCSLVGLYRHSRLCNALAALSLWRRHSSLHQWLERYLRIAPTYPHTRMYRVLGITGGKADAVIECFHGVLCRASGSSSVAALFGALQREVRELPHQLLATFLAGFAGGYALITTIQGEWSLRRLLYILLAAALCLALALVGNRWSPWLQKSFLYRLYQYIIK